MQGNSLLAKMGRFLSSNDHTRAGSDAEDCLDESAESSDDFCREMAPDPLHVYATTSGQGAGDSAQESKALQAKALKEVEEFASYLGMTPAEDRDLLWIAVEAMTAPLPANWSEHTTKDGQPYYYNLRTDHTQWEHPMDEYHRGLYKKMKAEKLQCKTEQQLAISKQDVPHKFAAEAARAAAAGMHVPRQKSNIIVGNGSFAGGKPQPSSHDSCVAVPAEGGARKPSSSGKGRNEVLVDINARIKNLAANSSNDSSPADSPLRTADGQGASSGEWTQEKEVQQQAAMARKEEKKKRLRNKLATLKEKTSPASTGEVEYVMSQADKANMHRLESEKLEALKTIFQDQDRKKLNLRIPALSAHLDPIAAGLTRHSSLGIGASGFFCLHAFFRACENVCIHAHVQTCMHACIYMRTCMDTYIYMYAYMCI